MFLKIFQLEFAERPFTSTILTQAAYKTEANLD